MTVPASAAAPTLLNHNFWRDPFVRACLFAYRKALLAENADMSS
jgi:hypothetical protein